MNSTTPGGSHKGTSITVDRQLAAPHEFPLSRDQPPNPFGYPNMFGFTLRVET